MSRRRPPPAPQSGSGQLLLRMRIPANTFGKYRIICNKNSWKKKNQHYKHNIIIVFCGEIISRALVTDSTVHPYTYVMYVHIVKCPSIFFFFFRKVSLKSKSVSNEPEQQPHIISEMLIWELGVYQVQVLYSRTNKPTGWRETLKTCLL